MLTNRVGATLAVARTSLSGGLQKAGVPDEIGVIKEMITRLIIVVITVSVFVILYIFLKRLSHSASRKRKYRKVEEKIRRKIKTFSKEI